MTTCSSNSIQKNLDIIYQDSDLVVINKPAGYFVHKTALAAKNESFLLQSLRDQLGMKVYTTHRLDKKTSGVLIFTLNKETQSIVNQIFRENSAIKKYNAIVRGWTNDSISIDSDVRDSRGRYKSAATILQTLAKVELEEASSNHPTSRYSLVELIPKTGRYHQLRVHMARINHPIIGDRPHGCNKQNRFFKERFGLIQMMLHASELKFVINKKLFHFKAPFPTEFQRISSILRLS